MSHKIIASILFFFATSFISNVSLAREVGYIISENGEFTKLDIGNQTIIRQGKLEGIRYIESGFGNVAYSKANNLLVIVESSRGVQSIFVYELQSLKLIKKLDIQSENIDQENAVRALVSPVRQIFYVKWWDNTANSGNGGQVITSFNTSSLIKLKDYMGVSLSDKLMISIDGTKIFSCSDEESLAKVDVFDPADFKLLKTIELEKIITSGIYGRAIDDFKNDKILLVENTKKNDRDPNNYVIYTVDLNSLIVSSKFRTGIEGDTFLFPSGRKAALNETQNISLTSLGNIKSIGKIHIYDLNIPKETGVITYKESSVGIILGVSRDENKLYYYFSNNDNYSKIIVIDVINNSILTNIRFSSKPVAMIIYDE